MTQLDGRMVLITGAAGGIASATARTVVAQGGRVVVHDRSASLLESLVDDTDKSTAPLPRLRRPSLDSATAPKG